MRKILVSTCLMLGVVLACALFLKGPREIPNYDLTVNPIDRMPLVQDDPFAAMAHGGMPDEQRGAEVRKWLAPGVKIEVEGASGSGTIIYFDPKDSYAYVQSCGHLWDGNMSAEEGTRRKLSCKVVTWYHNQEKLTSPKTYPAEVLYFSNSRGRDVSLVRFKPDWIPNYFPIAPESYEFKEGTRYHSVGCDGGREIAHYVVRYVGMRQITEGYADLVTTENSPRPGRSGGGLTDDVLFIGVCWGTTSYTGDGNGFFTPLKTVREYNKINGYGWLNDVGEEWARMIPIKDRNNPQGSYPQDYIPLPR